MTAFFDMPQEELEWLDRWGGLDSDQQNIILNWQLGITQAAANKMYNLVNKIDCGLEVNEEELHEISNLMNQIGCDIDVYLYDDCEDDEDE
jgi:hypothetical protein